MRFRVRKQVGSERTIQILRHHPQERAPHKKRRPVSRVGSEELIYGRMVESVDTLDSKSSAERHGGSSPSAATNDLRR